MSDPAASTELRGRGDTFAFGPFVLDEARGLLLRDGESLALTPKAHATLLHLVLHNGELVGKQDLLDAVWPGQFIEPNNLDQQISLLRRLLGDGCIETVPRRGYRFVIPVQRNLARQVGAAAQAPAILAAPIPSPVPVIAVSAPAAVPPAPLVVRGRGLWGLTGAFVAVALAVAVVFGLRWDARGLPLGHIRTIAVLPFIEARRPSSGDGVGLALADAVIGRLGYHPRLSVRPTGAVLRFEGGVDPAVAGRELQVDGVLQSTFRRDGEQVRVRTQLIDVREDVTVWSAQFDVTTRELPQFEDAIADALASRLLGTLAADEAAPARARVDPEAHLAYLRGRWHWNRRTPQDMQAAQREFERALTKAPGYAEAQAGLADALLAQGQHAGARAAARRALALDDGLAEPHATLGFLAWFDDRDSGTAQAQLARAIELNPSYPTGYQWLAFVHVAHRRCAAALQAIARASELDPTSLIVETDAAQLRYFCGDLAGAEREVRAALDLDPGFAQGRNVLAQVLQEEGRYAEARQALDAFTQLGPGPRHALLAELEARAGDTAAAIRDLDAATATDAYKLARASADVGRRDSALAYLRRAATERDSDVMLLAVDPAAAALRTDPRVQRLMQELGLPAAAQPLVR